MTVKELYDELHGSYEDATRRLMNDDLIKMFLFKFAHTSSIDNLDNLYQNNDNQGIFELTHSLKGVTANLALNELSENISDVCELVRNKENGIHLDLDEKITSLKEQFNLTIKTILNFEANL